LREAPRQRCKGITSKPGERAFRANQRRIEMCEILSPEKNHEKKTSYPNGNVLKIGEELEELLRVGKGNRARPTKIQVKGEGVRGKASVELGREFVELNHPLESHGKQVTNKETSHSSGY